MFPAVHAGQSVVSRSSRSTRLSLLVKYPGILRGFALTGSPVVKVVKGDMLDFFVTLCVGCMFSDG